MEIWRARGRPPLGVGFVYDTPPQKFSVILTSSSKVKIGQTVSLSTAERKLAHFVAKHRNGVNRYFNITNLKVSASDPVEIDLEGICGELAFCKLFNVYPDLDTDRNPPHPLHDCTLPPPPPGGLRIDVKTTKYENGKLLVDSRKGYKTDGVDYYALMTGTFPGPYTFRGLIAGVQMIRPGRLNLFCGHKSYIAEQSELTDELSLF